MLQWLSLFLERFLSDLKPISSQICNALINDGIQKGDTVQIAMHNNSEFFFPVLGAWMAGGVVSLSDPSLTSKKMRSQLEVTKAKFVFCSPDVAENIKEASETIENNNIKIITVNGSQDISGTIKLSDYIAGKNTNDNLQVHKQIKMNERAVIFWSSGTTGNPKGIVNTHEALIMNFTSKIFSPPATGNDCFLQTTCMFHGGGFLFAIINCIRNGVKLITFCLRDGVSTEDIFHACDKYQPSVLMVGSHHGFRLSNANAPKGLKLNSVLSIVPIGSHLRDDLTEDLKKQFPNAVNIVNAYGLTETSGVSKGNGFSNLGSLIRGVQVKISDPDTNEVLGPDQVGEILVKSEGLMLSYINVPEDVATGAFTDDGFFHTGDLGWYDKSGQLYYKERLKALIKYQNCQVYPDELENIIQKMPDVVEVGVFGLADPNVQELISAAVVLKAGSVLGAEEIVEHVNKQVEDFKKIRGGIYFVDELPRNLQGKLLRRNLPDLVNEK